MRLVTSRARRFSGRSRGRPMTRTTTTPSNLRRLARRRVTKQAGVIAALGVASLGAAGAIVASAAVPEFPNNLVVFPNRDFVVVEGYQDHVGETALVEVTRAGKVIGSAQAEVAAGDVAFEINHPGGACWGAGTGVDVTPDIKAGDKVSIRFAGDLAGDTTVQDVYVGATDYVPGATTFTVKRPCRHRREARAARAACRQPGPDRHRRRSSRHPRDARPARAGPQGRLRVEPRRHR